MPRVKKVKPPVRVLTNKLIAYYRINGKYDTQLDSLDVQKRRVAAWVERNNYKVVEEVISYGDTYDMAGIFKDAYYMCGHVIIASGCRVPGETADFCTLYQGEETPLLTTESIMNGCTTSKRNLGYVEMILFSAQEYYLGQCKEWLA